MKTKHSSILVATFACLTFMQAESRGQTILYSDTFNRTTGSGDPNGKPSDPENFADWGDNDNGLGGTITNSWLVGPSRGGGANATTDGMVGTLIEGGAHYVFDVTGMAPSGFTVEFDFNRFHSFNEPDPFGTNGGFISVGLGADTGAAIGGGQFTVNNSDVSILFQQSVGSNAGNTQIHQDGVLLFPAMATDPGPLDYGDPLVGHSVKLTVVPQANGAYGETDMVDISLEVDSGTPFDFTVAGGAEFGNLAFASNQFVHRQIDNLVVTALAVTGTPGDADGDLDVDGADFLLLQRNNDPSGIGTWAGNYGAGNSVASIGAVPEPASLVLLAFAGGIAGSVRRRPQQRFSDGKSSCGRLAATE